MVPPNDQANGSLGQVMWSVLLVLILIGAGLMVLPELLAGAPEPTIVVQAGRDLPALTLIGPGDVITAAVSGELPAGALLDPADAVGKVLTESVASSSTLVSASLVAAPPDSVLLSVPISGVLPPASGEQVILLGIDAAGDAATPISQQAVVVLKRNGLALLALPPEEAELAAPYLLAGRLLLLRRWR